MLYYDVVYIYSFCLRICRLNISVGMNNWKAQKTSSIEVDICGSRKASMVVTMLQSRMITIDVHVVSFISTEKKNPPPYCPYSVGKLQYIRDI